MDGAIFLAFLYNHYKIVYELQGVFANGKIIGKFSGSEIVHQP